MSMATVTGWKILSTYPQSGTRRLRQAPVKFSPRGIGETRIGALWLQDAWKIVPNLKLTLGARLETWRSLDGFNINSNPVGQHRRPGLADHRYSFRFRKNQPGLNSTNFSPKVSLSYDVNKEWNVTANFGGSYRYPTVTELYQNIVVNGVSDLRQSVLEA